MQSLIEKVGKQDVQADPFPHIVVPDALDEALCAQLCAEFPSVETITEGSPGSSNARFSLKAVNALDNPDVSPIWQDFIRYHTSGAFLTEVMELFEDHLSALYPDLTSDGKSFRDLRGGLREVDSFETADVLMEAQPSVNTAVTGPPTSVRSGHVDAPNKLFAGLFYLRPPEDQSTGGDLELYRYKKGNPQGLDGVYVHDRDTEVVSKVKYERNVLVLFVNSINSLHGVTPRSTTEIPRYFANLAGEVGHPLFDLDEYQEGWKDKLFHASSKVSRRVRAAR
jgi:2OG-Fe(II) oxygenase superfamily